MNDNPYFVSRADVGKRFAEELFNLRYENTAVLALSPGGVVIGIEIAKRLHSITGLLLLKHIHIPGGDSYGMINDQGFMTIDGSISISEAEEFKSEYRNSIDQEKMEALHQLHIIGHSGSLEPSYFNGRNVIIVNDISTTGTSFQAALDFLKPARLESVILVAAVAQEKSADIMHHLGDRVLIAHRTDKDFPSSHYFANDEIPETESLKKMMEQVILQW